MLKAMDVKITIIIPVYNVEEYLNQCLESVVNQTVPFDEVILVNDGSRDSSLSICESYVSRYEYFKLINQENKGLSAARNVGIEKASGEYLMFLDSDDYLSLNTVDVVKKQLSQSLPDALLFDAAIHCEEGIVSKHNYNRIISHLARVQMSGWEFFLNSYPESYIVSACFLVYKKSKLDSEGILFPEGIYYEDNYFSFAFLVTAEKVIYISEKLYQRRCRENSITTSEYSERKFVDYIKVNLLIWRRICERNIYLLEDNNNKLLEFINNNCYLIWLGYQLCQKLEINLSNYAKRYLLTMSELYENIIDSLYLKQEFENVFCLNKMLTNLHFIYLWCPENIENAKRLIQNIIRKQKKVYQKLLKELPLGQMDYKVGIYGTGKHTEGLLAIYNKLYGEIACDLTFIDSYKSNETYEGRKVINYLEINKNIQEIIVSSFLYEKDMVERIQSINKEIKIHTFYDSFDKDIFSEYKLFIRYLNLLG